MRDKPDDKEGTFAVNLGFGNLFKGIGNLFDLLSEVTETGEQEMTRTKSFGGEGKWKDVQGVYGFSIRMGAGGKAKVESFGNIKDTKRGPVVEEVREPMADVFDEGDTIQVICELPGVEAGEVQVKVEGDVLDISAEGKQRKYRKEILLSAPVRAKSLKQSYKNGILEVKLSCWCPLYTRLRRWALLSRRYGRSRPNSMVGSGLNGMKRRSIAFGMTWNVRSLTSR
jgi:HSP20 family protein